ncbi:MULTISPECIES: hypothetical protein [unclassified Streptomyces]|uniref:hypothetical protein n=1 Tax=unclassified Streptomyces TaxID=2593676 RepID=UPI000DD7B653|nr:MULTISPECIES: hypothetical protein [unclassified Streptomyces]QZZ25317.1 hypothetical protein A7X85_02505 [Streptomyces sp. ST1015]
MFTEHGAAIPVPPTTIGTASSTSVATPRRTRKVDGVPDGSVQVQQGEPLLHGRQRDGRGVCRGPLPLLGAGQEQGPGV